MLKAILSTMGSLLTPTLIRVVAYGGAGIFALIGAYNMGIDKMEKKYLRNQLELQEKVQKFNKKFNLELDAQAIIDQALAEKLKEDDEEAVNDSESTNRCIGVDGLRRLNQGFGHSTAPIEVDPAVSGPSEDQPKPES